MRTVDLPALAVPGAPLSHAVVVAGLVHCSGQVPLAPDGSLVSDDVAAMTRQALANLDAVLRAAGSALDRVVRTTVYLTDFADYQEMNLAYAELLAHRPARTCVRVAGLPLGARLEIDCVAVAGRAAADSSR
ncbi:RidA family protein [Nocardioides sp. L-11A]|uniref:RidA family protein n=1 Tax=Nocardioides sp. L-11A TaxID=3043848 RepID=UPI00249B3BDC|nr:RidA family protein [Nocardioides sp. L-11A]